MRPWHLKHYISVVWLGVEFFFSKFEVIVPWPLSVVAVDKSEIILMAVFGFVF